MSVLGRVETEGFTFDSFGPGQMDRMKGQSIRFLPVPLPIHT